MMEFTIGMFLKKTDVIMMHGVPTEIVKTHRIIGIDAKGISIQDVYGEIKLYRETTVQNEFEVMDKKERIWLIHAVQPIIPAPGNYRNVHTHGAFWYSGMDFQVVIPYSSDTVCQLLTMMVKRAQNGELFKDGDLVAGLFYEYPVKLLSVKESGRQVLRLLIPDENGYFPDDARCNNMYQYQMLPMFE